MYKKIILVLVLIIAISSCQDSELQKVEKKLDNNNNGVIIQTLKTKGKGIAAMGNTGSIKGEEGFTN